MPCRRSQAKSASRVASEARSASKYDTTSRNRGVPSMVKRGPSTPSTGGWARGSGFGAAAAARGRLGRRQDRQREDARGQRRQSWMLN